MEGLEPILQDPNSGLPSVGRMFDNLLDYGSDKAVSATSTMSTSIINMKRNMHKIHAIETTLFRRWFHPIVEHKELTNIISETVKSVMRNKSKTQYRTRQAVKNSVVTRPFAPRRYSNTLCYDFSF